MSYIKVAIICLTILLFSGSLNGSEEQLRRRKRFLIWQEGLNWVQLVAGIGLPAEVKDQSITIGAVVKAFYLLPTNSSDFTRPMVDFARKKRSASRWVLYSAFEKFVERFGYGSGKACMLKAICDAAAVPFDGKSGLLAEIAHAFLTPSSTLDVVDSHTDLEYHSAEKLGNEVDRCELLFPECNVQFMEQFTRWLV